MPPRAKNTDTATVASSSDAPPQPAPKRQRKTQSRVKGRQGALKKAMDLPVDLIWEICTHLDVQDLFALSNTNKNFRAVVTGEGSSVLFEKARKRLEMPELKIPMTDLQYAAMIYGKGCDFCGKKNAGKLDTIVRARVCGVCYKTKFKTIEQCGKETRDQRPFLCADPIRVKTGAGLIFLTSQVERISKEMAEKFPTNAFIRMQGLIHIPSLKFPREDGLTLEDAESANDDWTYIFMSNGFHENPKPGLQTWMYEWQEYRKLKMADAAALEVWLEKIKFEKSRKAIAEQRQRREIITERLEAAGFKQSEFTNAKFSRHPQVNNNKPLTDRHYLKTVEPALRQLLEENRRERTREALKKHYNDLRQTLPGGYTLPPASIYLGLPVLQPFINDVSVNHTESSLAPPDEIKAVALEEMSRLARDRLEKCLRSLVVAHKDLAKEEKERKPKRLGTTSTEEEYCPTTYTRVGDLPLTLHRLPPWIPRNESQPILASDEQIQIFLENSPLARFECIRCRKLYDGPLFFRHFDSWGQCVFSRSSESQVVVELKDWMRINCEGGHLRIDKDVLSLQLKLAHLIDATPREMDNHRKLPSLGPEYEIALAKEDWYHVKLWPLGSYYYTDGTIRDEICQAYYRLSDAGERAQVRTEVEYSRAYRAEYRSLKRIQQIQNVEDWGYEYDSEGNRHHAVGYGGGYDDWGSDSGMSVGSHDEEEDEREGCVIM
ncbi:hypothetical protein JCM5350_005088 [Sporobolomyces pararoseus]